MATKPPMLLSVLVSGFKAAELESLFTEAFGQSVLANFEFVLYIENDDEAWALGNRYAQLMPERITLVHCMEHLPQDQVFKRMIQVTNSPYYIQLAPGEPFEAVEMANGISMMETDCLFEHPRLHRIWTVPRFINPHAAGDNRDYPLVSICVYNYNYGRYLSQCLESIFDQTYPNIEVCFSDNASSDESWQLAQAFFRRYEQRGRQITLIRNRENFGPGTNLSNCLNFARGKYLLVLCSDDALKPECIERCVSKLEKTPDAGFAIVHRDILDGEGNVTTEPSFYDQTCVISGEDQAAVYMMAAVSLSHSQVVYRRERWLGAAPSAAFTHRWFANRLWDFCVCLKYSVVYIKDALVLNREHGASDSSEIDRTLIQGMGQYALVLQFAEIANSYGLEKPGARVGEAIAKVARICLRFCTRFLMRDDETTASRYLHLAQAIFPGIVDETDFILLRDYFAAEPETRQTILAGIAASSPLVVRRVSYAPPHGSLPC